MIYELEKRIWTEADFDQMGWHDNRIYQIRYDADLELDIDYICKWNKPEWEGCPFTFWIAPATLVFKKVTALQLGINLASGELIEIEDIERAENDEWIILTRQGDIRFTSPGYEQYIRQVPVFQYGQEIPLDERNGISLERTTNQENPNLKSDTIIQRHQLQKEQYEQAKTRFLLKKELEKLLQNHDENKTELKEFLLKKKELNDRLISLNNLLSGTIFEEWGR
ncbi:MAG: hypothetical protein NTW29_12390 [Bacteroidetes bacterium]|nr:hypothetical protein [Bacteroidota bacterium]